MAGHQRTTGECPALPQAPVCHRNMDVYQWLLMLSMHSQRHIVQIPEIKAHAPDRKRKTNHAAAIPRVQLSQWPHACHATSSPK